MFKVFVNDAGWVEIHVEKIGDVLAVLREWRGSPAIAPKVATKSKARPKKAGQNAKANPPTTASTPETPGKPATPDTPRRGRGRPKGSTKAAKAAKADRGPLMGRKPAGDEQVDYKTVAEYKCPTCEAKVTTRPCVYCTVTGAQKPPQGDHQHPAGPNASEGT